jgi:hypothetical protein
MTRRARSTKLTPLELEPNDRRPIPHVGTAGPRAFDTPGYAKATLAFQTEPSAPAGSLVTTETRVFAADAATQRRFGTYWRIIYPGSALIRRMWLRAIRRRAQEADPLERFPSVRIT